MTTKKTKSTTTTASTKERSRRPTQLSNARMMQNFLIVWLDGNIDEMGNVEYDTSITKLREVVNTVNTFTDMNECVNFITNIKTKNIFIISSGTLGQKTVPTVHSMAQVNSIYIFCGNKTQHEQWAKQWPKIKGVFTEIKPICEALEKAVKECDQNTISMSFVATSNDAMNKNLDRLDQSFVCIQILKEILLTINFDQEHMKEFIVYCREQFDGNMIELKNIDQLEKEYRQHTPIWWYTNHYFLYSMINHALRTMEVDLIVRLGFFLCDLHKNISQLYSEQHAGHYHSYSIVVYRGQGLSQIDFDRLMKTPGGFLSFNNFLSTSKHREISLEFARKTMENSDLVGILFIMTIDPSIPSAPFAGVSYHQTEEGILFPMHSIFRIEQITNIGENKPLWQVNLSLTSDNDPQLHALTEQIREETYPHAKGWHRLGKLLVKLSQFEKAQRVFEIMLPQTSDDREKSGIYHMLGMIKDKQGDYVAAVKFYEKSIKINQKILPQPHFDLATSYSCLGQVYETIGEYSKALTTLEKALEIQQKTLPPNHPDLATSYGNIGNVLKKMGEYSKALSSHEKAYEIYRKTLPSNHPHLAISNNNIGEVYDKMSNYSKAVSFFERAVDIGQHSLPANHSDLQIWKSNLESVKKKL